jgi:hypothetical protein
MTLHHYERIHKQSSEMIVHSLEIIMVLMVCNNFLYSVKAVGGVLAVSKLRRQKEAKILCQIPNGVKTHHSSKTLPPPHQVIIPMT